MEDTTKLLMELGNNIIKVLEKYKMTNAASTMRKEMATSKSKPNNDESLLSVIRKTVVNKEKKKLREETKQLNLHYKPLKADVDSSFNKEETEAIMEKLMNRIVANPKLFNGDDELNHKIEKIFNLEAFQKMVENADIFQDLSSSSIFSNSQILHKSMISQNTPMQQILQPASVNESSDIGDSHDFVDELIHKENEDSLLKIEKESMKTLLFLYPFNIKFASIKIVILFYYFYYIINK